MCATLTAQQWHRPTTPADVYRRAGGRRHRNALRRAAAWARRRVVAYRLLAGASQSEIARALGVHRATVCRDLAAIRTEWPLWEWGIFASSFTVTGAQLDALARMVEGLRSGGKR
jgi:DNA invertase Pin-like site-specific DNA recombinase